MRILRESTLEGEKIGSIFDVELEELVGGTSGRDQQLGGYLSLPLWRKIRAGGRDLRDMSIRNHRGGGIIHVLIRMLQASRNRTYT